MDYGDFLELRTDYGFFTGEVREGVTIMIEWVHLLHIFWNLEVTDVLEWPKERQLW